MSTPYLTPESSPEELWEEIERLRHVVKEQAFDFDELKRKYHRMGRQFEIYRACYFKCTCRDE